MPHMDTPPRSCRPAVAGLIGLALFAALFGCALPGVMAYKFFPPIVPARYTPPKDQPLLVLVEAGYTPAASVPEAEELLQALHADLAAHKVAPMVELARVYDLRDQEGRSFSKLSIS